MPLKMHENGFWLNELIVGKVSEAKLGHCADESCA